MMKREEKKAFHLWVMGYLKRHRIGTNGFERTAKFLEDLEDSLQWVIGHGGVRGKRRWDAQTAFGFGNSFFLLLSYILLSKML